MQILLLLVLVSLPIVILTDSKRRLGKYSWGWALLAFFTMPVVLGELGPYLQRIAQQGGDISSAAAGRLFGGLTGAWLGGFALYRIATKKQASQQTTGKEQSFRCDLCDEVFSLREKALSHVQITHGMRQVSEANSHVIVEEQQQSMIRGSKEGVGGGSVGHSKSIFEYCPHCDAMIDEKWTRCQSCGGKIREELSDSSVPGPTSDIGKLNAETRLQELKNLFEKGLSTIEEYERKRAEILDEL